MMSEALIYKERKSRYLINFKHGISRGGYSEYKFHEVGLGIYCILPYWYGSIICFAGENMVLVLSVKPRLFIFMLTYM